jgi:hypothetical protein
VTITIDMQEMIDGLTVVSDGNEQIYNALLMLNGLLAFTGALLVVILFAIVWGRW